MNVKILKGWYRTPGGHLQSGNLILCVNERGAFVDEAHYAATARHCAESDTQTVVEITSAGAAWRFVAAGGECKRVGLPICP